MSFLDCNGILIPSMYDQWKESGSVSSNTGHWREKDNKEREKERDIKEYREDKALKAPSKIHISNNHVIYFKQNFRICVICSGKMSPKIDLTHPI